MPRPSRQRRRARTRARSSARTPQDDSYKHLFSHPEMVEGLLRDFVQEDWLALIDVSRPSWCGWKCWRPTAPRRCARSCSG